MPISNSIRRLRRLFPAATAAALLAGASCIPTPGFAQGAATDVFSPAQRKAIVEIVRNALKTDPTILSDAITSLRQNAANQQQLSAQQALAAHRSALLNPAASDAILGNAQAKVTVVEFYDPRCPYCRKVLPDLDRIVAEDKDVRILEKVVPVLGQGSLITSQALVAAFEEGGQGAYFKLQHAIMTDSAAPTVERMRTLAKQCGLNADQLAKDMNSPRVTAILQANMELGHGIGLDGTPTFVMNARQIIPGAVDYDELKQAIAHTR
ncbi:DsbA family protein [Novacetimonas pomaceti]|uniref:DsbA family protein n=1 Tax=Novacetimonas pomaceti TaxID=2021998 RepID=UPI0038D1E74D